MFRLAGHLGMTVNQLLENLGDDELPEWKAFSRIEPFGQARQDFHACYIISAVLNAFKAKGSKVISPGDLMPDWESVTLDPVEALENKAKVLAMTIGGTIDG